MKQIHLFFLLIGSLLLVSCQHSKTPSRSSNFLKFSEYIATTPKYRQSVAKPIRVILKKPLKQFDWEQSISSSYLSISPSVDGQLEVKNSRVLLFTPDEHLQPQTKYKVSVNLGKLYNDVPKALRTYTFTIKTRTPNFVIHWGHLQSYSKHWQYVTGVLESADYIPRDKLPKLLHAKQDDKSLTINWKHSEKGNTYFRFIIDSIRRKADDSQIHIRWDGSAIEASLKGENELTIPGYNTFKVVNLQTQPAPKASLAINFSDPLQPDQDFSGLVKMEKIKDLRFETDGNVLYVYPGKRIAGEVKVTVYPGIKNKAGVPLKKQFSDRIAFKQLKPAVKLISKGILLPSAQSTPLYFKAVNLSAVDVHIIKIYQDNILQYLQSHNLNSNTTYDLNQVGRQVAEKTIHLDVAKNEKGYWKAYAIKLSDFFKADPGSLYRVEFSFKKSYSTYLCQSKNGHSKEKAGPIAGKIAQKEEKSREEKYWNNETNRRQPRIYDWQHRDNPCYPVYYQPRHFASTNILGTNLGLLVKKGTNHTYRFFTTNLLSAQPESGVTLKLYNFQQQLLTTLHTGAKGSKAYTGTKPVAFVVAQKGNNYAYAKLNDGNALSMSKFKVSGQKLQQGLKGYLYTERGVYRPGDTIHLTFVLNDKNHPLPPEVPVRLRVKNARGKLVQQTVLPTEAAGPPTRGRAKNNFYYFPIPTQTTAPTGNWRAAVHVGGAVFHKTLKVATVKPNRLKIDLDFDHTVLQARQPISGLLTGAWLHGAPARNLKAEMSMTLTPYKNPFPDYKDYTFSDPVRQFSRTEIPLLKGKLSASGTLRFKKKIELKKQAPGMLKASFLTKLFEGGGDFSIDVYSKKLAPYRSFVGLKAPKPNLYGGYLTNEDQRFNLLTLTPDGKPAGNKKLRVQIFKIQWRWWWNRGRDNLSEYKTASLHKPLKDFQITTGTDGKAHFSLHLPKDLWGRYLIRVKDSASGHATGMTAYFFRNRHQQFNGSHAENASMLVFTADKDHYEVGDTAAITFPSSRGSHALISIENGTEVLSTKWVKTEAKKTRITLPLTADMAPNIYVTISLLQPHDQTKNDRPIRLYGVLSLTVKNPKTILHPQLSMPKTLQPNTDFTVKVSEKNGKAMTYTLAVVDEGLLDLTRFPTPAIHKAFYHHEALGVKTFDVYDDVIGAYSGSVNNIYEIGGDKFAKGAKKHKANRFKPVVQYLGPFHLGAGETATHHLHMPNYIGAVRTMVVAGNESKAAYGNAEKTTPVKKPLMVLASLPRKLSPGETVTIPVTVFAMHPTVKNVTVKLHTGMALHPLGKTTKKIHFDQPGSQLLNFKYKVTPSDHIQKIKVTASGNGEKALYNVAMKVVNPNPVSHTVTAYTLDKNGQLKIKYKPYGIKGTNHVKIELSTLPPMDFTKRFQYLIHYPYGCVEQTTSAGFPQLYLGKIFDLTSARKKELERHVKAVIQRLGEAQLPNGALPFWPGQRTPNSWATSYAGHFMIEAKNEGYALPISFLNSWLQYQKQAARHWDSHAHSFNSSLGQAYRLFTLSLAGQPNLAAMNRLRESGEMSNNAKWRLAAAYALAGKRQAAKALAATANIDFKPHRYDYYTFGSPFRNEAMALETMVILGNEKQHDLALSLAKKLSSNDWLSTQETAYALMAMGKMVEKNGGKELDVTLTKNEKTTAIKTPYPMAERSLESDMKPQTITLNNKKANVVFVSLYQEGKRPLGKEKPNHQNLVLKTRFLGDNGKKLSVSKLHQGASITAEVQITNTSSKAIHHLALTQLFPGGWEIVNTSFTQLKGTTEGNADYTDIRDDRVNFFFDLKAGASKTFSVKLNASYLGRYYLPGAQAEAMYNPRYNARTKGQWVTIIP